MIIRTVHIHNFRVYHDSHHLEFSADPERNISLISGSNGFGKTSFLTALVWGLYGKLMVDVDDRYRREVYESGGYKPYCKKIFNRLALTHAEQQALALKEQLSSATGSAEKAKLKEQIGQLYTFSIELTFSNLLIPSLPCNEVRIRRVHNVATEKETVEIFIDGKLNELTKETAAEIFINDFILPKEIAKFFFFDAEKIVSLAESKAIEEKRFLSHAYAEVLGIKRYTDLKENLENMLLRLRKKKLSKADQAKQADLEQRLQRIEALRAHYEHDVVTKREGLAIKKDALNRFQEQLIREGSTLSLAELDEQRRHRTQLAEHIQQTRQKFNELMELAPFAMLAPKLEAVRQQLEREEQQHQGEWSAGLLKQKYEQVSSALAMLKLGKAENADVQRILQEHLLLDENNQLLRLLDFSPEQRNRFYSVYHTLHHTYSATFKTLVNELKRLQSQHAQAQRKIQDAESRNTDEVVRTIRARKEEAEAEVKKDEHYIATIEAKRIRLQIEGNALKRQLSEQLKYVRIAQDDVQKEQTALRLIAHLDRFVQQLKEKKKASLEKNILLELNRLMHKQQFVQQVKVQVAADLIDIDLIDANGQAINKDGLSKGEQQLYATALLKALSTESNIRFPVFIDSPLQKLDRHHAQNIITRFYPAMGSQVVLFPLLEKELNRQEYEGLLPKTGKTYLIQQLKPYHSHFVQVEPELLFDVQLESHV